MHFQILGSLDLHASGEHVNLGPPKQRAIILPLLLEPNTAIGFDTLVERVWDESPPADVRNVVYTYVTRLRRILENANESSGSMDDVRIVRQNGGYLLDINPARIDLHRFYALLKDAKAENDPRKRATLQKSALDLRRGCPIANISGSWATRVREWLDHEWLDAMTDWAETEIITGNSDLVITELRRVMANNPHSELVIEKLLKALMHTGRTIEALELYGTARVRIIEMIGAEPGPRLRDIHHALLTSDPHDPRLSA
jgi:DNA-binding SARP family transcriptional activator